MRERSRRLKRRRSCAPSSRSTRGGILGERRRATEVLTGPRQAGDAVLPGLWTGCLGSAASRSCGRRRHRRPRRRPTRRHRRGHWPRTSSPRRRFIVDIETPGAADIAILASTTSPWRRRPGESCPARTSTWPIPFPGVDPAEATARGAAFTPRDHRLAAGNRPAALVDLEVRERAVTIRDAANREVVATIEVLSPFNKTAGSAGARSLPAQAPGGRWRRRPAGSRSTCCGRASGQPR